LEIQGVSPGLEELVVVDAALSQVDRLRVEDLAFRVRRGVARPPQDRNGVRVLGSKVPSDFTLLRPQCLAVVIPVHGHRNGICHE
jgi:hypothetical protein